MEVAAAALAMARIARNDAPLVPIGAPRAFERPERSGPREHVGPGGGHRDRHAPESGMVRIALDAGRMNGVLPNMVVSAIARTADIPGRELGKILIQDRRTLVDVPASLVDRVLAQSGDYRFGKRLATAEVA
jgi:ATP-dependent RNA helicase DeaD